LVNRRVALFGILRSTWLDYVPSVSQWPSSLLAVGTGREKLRSIEVMREEIGIRIILAQKARRLSLTERLRNANIGALCWRKPEILLIEANFIAINDGK